MSLNLILLLLTALLCTGYGQQISNCGEQNRVDADEGRAFNLTCTHAFRSPLQWVLHRPDGSVITLATCSLPALACNSSSSNYNAVYTQRYVSTLTVQQNLRTSIAGRVSCYVSVSQTYCDVRVVYPAKKVSNSSVAMNMMNWTLSASVDVNKIYASDGRYICQWTFSDWTAAQMQTNEMTIDQNFTEAGKEFNNGKCAFGGVPMPTSDGVYNYCLAVNPGEGILAKESFQIRQPGSPTLDHCPAVITEGNDVKCTCRYSDSSPPALVTWFPGTDFNALLQLLDVRMTQNGTNYTCSQYWGGDYQNQITYTLHVMPRLTPKDESDMTAEITGGVVVFVVAALVVAVVVMWIKTCNPVYADPRRRSEVEDSHVYSDLASFYEQNVPAPSGKLKLLIETREKQAHT
ncbi:hypothetical protein V1264_010528 [Littorina saxatilis]|uniref:Ig-like domain-containing protein n=1 Tax=Littorina saxatilis TaxID=31220 RepID=A0AAN9APL2_9CAEN